MITKEKLNEIERIFRMQIEINDIAMCAIKSLQKRVERAEFLIEDLYERSEVSGVDLSNTGFNPLKRFEI